MSIINQASKRLEQLRQAGVELPWADAPAMAEPSPAPASAEAPVVASPVAMPVPAPTPTPAPIAPPAPPAVAAAPAVQIVPAVAASPAPTPLAQVAAPISSVVPLQARPAAPAAVPPAIPIGPAPIPVVPPLPAAVATPLAAAVVAPIPSAPVPSEPVATAPAKMPMPAQVAAPAVVTGTALAVQPRGGPHSDTLELDLPALAQRKFLVPGCDDRALINEFRALKRTLVSNALGKNAANVKRGNVIVVTSAMPGEGKTYCAINLAMSMAAQVDNTVLLVDADVVKPAVSQRLGLPPTLGLLDLLSEKPRPMHEVMLRTNLPKLSLLASSAPRSDSAERISSDRMEALIEEMAQRYPDRIIVIDAPPLLLTNESRVLAALAGQVVMVVEAGRTTRRAVADAFQAVATCPVVMSVLNKRSQAMRGYGYGYGYGDGY